MALTRAIASRELEEDDEAAAVRLRSCGSRAPTSKRYRANAIRPMTIQRSVCFHVVSTGLGTVKRLGSAKWPEPNAQ